MLKSRVLTSLVLAVAALMALLLLPPLALTLLLALIFFAVGGWESCALAGLRPPAAIVVWILILALFGAGLLYLLHQQGGEVLVFGVATAGKERADVGCGHDQNQVDHPDRIKRMQP